MYQMKLILTVLRVNLDGLRRKVAQVIPETKMKGRVTDAHISLQGEIHHVGVLSKLNFGHCSNLAKADFVKLHGLLIVLESKIVVGTLFDDLDWLRPNLILNVDLFDSLIKVLSCSWNLCARLSLFAYGLLIVAIALAEGMRVVHSMRILSHEIGVALSNIDDP